MVDAPQPIIKRKKVVAGDGHHGGAWKVAYADFVTAMMAFFLLMWLLNATTEDQRKGLADYFNPSIPVSKVSGGGPDAFEGTSIYAEMEMAQKGTGSSSKQIYAEEAAKVKNEPEEDGNEAIKRMTELEKAIAEENGLVGDHLRIKMTPEGLVIELVESEGEALFAAGNATPSPLLLSLLEIVTSSFSDVKNNIKIVGHTDAHPYGPNSDYTNWELSADRANMARKLLVNTGFPTSQIVEVAGKASSDPLSDDIYAAENRRISITILRNR